VSLINGPENHVGIREDGLRGREWLDGESYQDFEPGIPALLVSILFAVTDQNQVKFQDPLNLLYSSAVETEYQHSG